MMLSNTNYNAPTDARRLRNEDPITGELGAHPIGSGLGAALGGAAVGAAGGSLAGPIGTVAGTIAGGFAGAIAGRAIAENVNPTLFESDEEFWRQNYATRPYYDEETDFEMLRPAYQFGRDNFSDVSQTWDDREPELRRKWEEGQWEGEKGGMPRIPWDKARFAARDAFERMSELDRNQD